MAHTITFDTLAFAKRLQAAGFTEEQAAIQAEVLVIALNEFQETQTETLATKSDIRVLQKDIKALELKIEKTKADLLKWMAGMFLTQTALIVALVKLLIS